MSDTEKVVDTENPSTRFARGQKEPPFETWVLVIICNFSFPNYALKWSSDQNCEF